MAGIPPIGTSNNQSIFNLLNQENLKSNDLLKNAAFGQASMSTISELGQTINNLYSYAQKTGDENVINGFKSALTSMGNDITSSRAVNFLTYANTLKTNNAESFMNLFSTLGKLSNENLGANTNSVIDTINNAQSKFGQGGADKVLEGLNKILETGKGENPLGITDTLNTYLNQTNTILNSGKEQSEIEKVLNDFLTGLGEQESIASINQYLTNFKPNL